MSVYKVIELVGTSTVSWEDAAKNAIDEASKTLKDLRIAEVLSQDLKIEEDAILECFRASVRWPKNFFDNKPKYACNHFSKFFGIPLK